MSKNEHPWCVDVPWRIVGIISRLYVHINTDDQVGVTEDVPWETNRDARRQQSQPRGIGMGRKAQDKEKNTKKNKIETKPVVILDTILAIKLREGITDKAAPQGR